MKLQSGPKPGRFFFQVVIAYLLFIYLAISAYLSCLVIDDTGIVKLEIVSAKRRRIEIYSNWGDSDRSSRGNLRLRVSGVQILYLLGLLAMTFFLFWRAINP